MSDPLIGCATPDDAPELAEVYHSAYARNRELGFPASAESVEVTEVADWIRDHRVFVARVDGDIVGGVRVTETDPDRVKISRFGVHEEWKGQGIGGRLLDHAEDAARADGYERVWLTTPGEHPFLPTLYRSRGYEETGDYPLDYRDYDEIVMEKRL
ncbi:Predicted N-acetyltransferase YhbS [Halomicrobium zhouii]|uniref:Predicted N-acetyltransferase YhbS n=1 Tax=Halomicrobium zhouii TaxID=767519 RepID=A0A1I6L3P6_9EURY|nr:GNAT family N-acetyltransferase [Halomicrobium zhouii]SFR97908.1 Predicted N-acetyltransferase YhbS [Halomicrobium zhouii]